jgi:hypothetical protein
LARPDSRSGCRRLIVQGRVRTHGVAVLSPALDYDLRSLEREEEFSVERFVPEFRVEAFTITVVPRTDRHDVSRLAPTIAIQSLSALAIISGPLSERIFAGMPRRMNRSDSTSMTSTAFSCLSTLMAMHSLVNSSAQTQRVCREYADFLSIVGPILYKIVGPDMVWVLRPKPDA